MITTPQTPFRVRFEKRKAFKLNPLPPRRPSLAELKGKAR